MRPVGEVREALFNAALVLTTPERAPTLLELAHHARVGYAAARRTVSNMCRAGVLEPVRDREVDYRHKPVKEYSPCRRRGVPSRSSCPLGDAIATWPTAAV